MIAEPNESDQGREKSQTESLAISPVELAEYRRGWQRRREKRRENLRQRKAELLRLARLCAKVLVDDFGVNAVFLFGSLTRSRQIHETTDIDLAVEGLEDREYFPALTALDRVLPPGVALDLVPLEDARPYLVDVVRTRGVQLA